MKTNLCIIGLARDLLKDVAYQLSLKLDMFYADVNDLLQFELVNIDDVIDKCGAPYVAKLEGKKVKTVATFDNTVYTMEFATLNANMEEKAIKENAILIFLDVPKIHCKEKKSSSLHKINNLMLKDRKRICEECCDIKVSCRKLEIDHILHNIYQAIQQFMKKGK